MQSLRESAQKNRPWDHTTGPKTWHGKRTSSTNAFKTGLYCRGWMSGSLKQIRKVLGAFPEDEASR